MSDLWLIGGVILTCFDR